MQDAFAAFLFALDAMTPSAYSYRIKAVVRRVVSGVMAVGFSSPYGIPLARSSKSAASDRTRGIACDRLAIRRPRRVTS